MSVHFEDVLATTVIHDNDTSGEAVNRFQFRVDTEGETDEADVLDDIADIIALLYGIVQSIISVRSVLREVNVYNITQLKIIGSTDAGAYTGGVGTDPAAPQGVAPLTYFKTVYPRVILSKYIPTPPAGALGVSGLLTGPALALTTSFAANLLTQFVMTNATYSYGHWQKLLLRWVEPVLAVAPLTPAYQRRRKPGRGS